MFLSLKSYSLEFVNDGIPRAVDISRLKLSLSEVINY